jgi:hypothetical protein
MGKQERIPSLEEFLRAETTNQTNTAREFISRWGNEWEQNDMRSLFWENLKRRFQYLGKCMTEGHFSSRKYLDTKMWPYGWRSQIDIELTISQVGGLTDQLGATSIMDTIADFDRWHASDRTVPDGITYYFGSAQEESLLGFVSKSSHDLSDIRDYLGPFIFDLYDQHDGICVLSNFASGMADGGFVTHWIRSNEPCCPTVHAIGRYSPTKIGDYSLTVFPCDRRLVDRTKAKGQAILFVDHFSRSGNSIRAFYELMDDYPPAYAIISNWMLQDGTSAELQEVMNIKTWSVEADPTGLPTIAMRR